MFPLGQALPDQGLREPLGVPSGAKRRVRQGVRPPLPLLGAPKRLGKAPMVPKEEQGREGKRRNAGREAKGKEENGAGGRGTGAGGAPAGRGGVAGGRCSGLG